VREPKPETIAVRGSKSINQSLLPETQTDRSIKAAKQIASTLTAKIFVAATIDDGIRSAQLPANAEEAHQLISS